MFMPEDIEECLRIRPWLCNKDTMPESYFRSVVREEYKNNPWYDCHTVAKLINVKADETVRRYLRKGFLKGVKAPGGPHQYKWIIRQSTIEEFLAIDPRPSRNDIARTRRLAVLRRKGKPRKLSTRWLIRCPLCLGDVIVTASPYIFGTEIMKIFTRLYTNGKCSHGEYVEIVSAKSIDKIEKS